MYKESVYIYRENFTILEVTDTPRVYKRSSSNEIQRPIEPNNQKISAYRFLRAYTYIYI